MKLSGRLLVTPEEFLAISATFLTEHPIYHNKVDAVNFVALTVDSGTNRVYDRGEVEFVAWDGDHTATDSNAGEWPVRESGLAFDTGNVLPRLPAHREFWVGWYFDHSHTRLVM